MGERTQTPTENPPEVVIPLVDTSVVVDLLRAYPPADLWLKTHGQLALPEVVWIEILEGVLNREKQRQALKMLRRFVLIEVTSADIGWATQTLIRLGLSYEIDGYDCMIAAVSLRLQQPLYTRNLKHFVPLIGDLAHKPY